MDEEIRPNQQPGTESAPRWVTEFETRKQQFLEQLKAQTLSDPESKRDLQMYLGFGTEQNEAERRVISQFANAHNILYPVSDCRLAENTFTVAPMAKIAFEPIEYCLGVVVRKGNMGYAAHVVTEENFTSDKANHIVGQVDEFGPSNPEEILMVSAHLGETDQHKHIIEALKMKYPRAAITMKKNSGI